MFTHEFLYFPGCLRPLLGRDLLNTQITDKGTDKGTIRLQIKENKFLEARGMVGFLLFFFLLQEEEQKSETPVEALDAVNLLVGLLKSQGDPKHLNQFYHQSRIPKSGG